MLRGASLARRARRRGSSAAVTRSVSGTWRSSAKLRKPSQAEINLCRRVSSSTAASLLARRRDCPLRQHDPAAPSASRGHPPRRMRRRLGTGRRRPVGGSPRNQGRRVARFRPAAVPGRSAAISAPPVRSARRIPECRRPAGHRRPDRPASPGRCHIPRRTTVAPRPEMSTIATSAAGPGRPPPLRSSASRARTKSLSGW